MKQSEGQKCIAHFHPLDINMEIKNCYDFGVTVAEPYPSSFDLGSSFGAAFSSVGFSFFFGFTLAEPLPFPLVRAFTNISSPPKRLFAL